MAGGLSLLTAAWIIARKNIFQKPFFGIITYLCFFCLGAVNLQLRSPEYQPRHFTHFTSENNHTRLVLDISTVQKPNNFNSRFIAEVRSVDSIPTHSKILVYLQRDSVHNMPVPGERFIVFGKPAALADPRNPGEFDYARYLRNKDIHRQLRITSEEIIRKETNSDGFRGQVTDLRNSMLKKLDSLPFGADELGILQALSLGHKNSIDKDVYKSYAEAGAIHVLAVSGLHVGIIYFLLNWLFQPLIFLPKGRHIIVILVVLSLVFYALITGMSPSVTRAVTMFSFFGLARLLNRPTNTINTLFLSFFFLLLWNPKWLLDVGFQLSYTAVFFILWLHPKIGSLYHPKFYLDKIVWNTLSVSFCAQLGVAPLSIYYFNQFPGLFLLSNLVILPCIGILVAGGLIVVILASVDLAPNWLVLVVDWMVTMLNKFVHWISEQEQFIFRDLVISEMSAFCFHLVIISFSVLLSKFSFNGCRNFLISIIVFLLTLSSFDLDEPTDKLIIFHKSKHTIVGVLQKRNLLVLKQDSSNLAEEYPIHSFRKNMGVMFYSEEFMPKVLNFKRSTILMVDSSGIYPRDRNVDIVLLSGSPKVHLELLIDDLKPKRIIADGSNYVSLVRRWQTTCRNRKLPFHHTGDSGAFHTGVVKHLTKSYS